MLLVTSVLLLLWGHSSLLYWSALDLHHAVSIIHVLCWYNSRDTYPCFYYALQRTEASIYCLSLTAGDGGLTFLFKLWSGQTFRILWQWWPPLIFLSVQTVWETQLHCPLTVCLTSLISVKSVQCCWMTWMVMQQLEINEWQHWYYSVCQSNISLCHCFSRLLENLSCVDWYSSGIFKLYKQLQIKSHYVGLIFSERDGQITEMSKGSWDGDDTQEDVWLWVIRVLNQITSWSVKVHFSCVFITSSTCSVCILNLQRCCYCKLDLFSI